MTTLPNPTLNLLQFGEYADPEVFNRPSIQLIANDTTLNSGLTTVTDEVVEARDTYPTLDSRLDDMQQKLNSLEALDLSDLFGATTDTAGLIELATQAETNAGIDNSRAITPATLSSFPHQHMAVGYQKLPGGLILQWGSALIASGIGTQIIFPVAFPTQCFTISVTVTDSVFVNHVVSSLSKFGATIKHNGNGGVNVTWLVLGC